MAKKSASFWTSIGTGTLSVLAIVWAAVATSRCSSNEQKYEQKATELKTANTEISGKNETIIALKKAIDDYKDENKALRDSMEVQQLVVNNTLAQIDSVQEECLKRKQARLKSKSTSRSQKQATPPKTTTQNTQKKQVVAVSNKDSVNVQKSVANDAPKGDVVVNSKDSKVIVVVGDGNIVKTDAPDSTKNAPKSTTFWVDYSARRKVRCR